MSMELKMLAWSIVLGLLQVALAATVTTGQRGFGGGAGARDGDPAPVTPLAGRLNRAAANFLETFPLFAAAVLAVVVAGRTSFISELGAWMYFIGRLVYLPLYALGVPVVRTIVWAVATLGVVLELWALLGG
jgi:uncharacterized MAPEG superfamily protein